MWNIWAKISCLCRIFWLKLKWNGEKLGRWQRGGENVKAIFTKQQSKQIAAGMQIIQVALTYPEEYMCQKDVSGTGSTGGRPAIDVDMANRITNTNCNRT